MTKAFKLEVLIVDHENSTDKNIITSLEANKYISPTVINIEGVDIGEWSDDNPLNYDLTIKDEVRRLFGEKEDTYLVFAGGKYYPNGGGYDYYHQSNNKEEAIKKANELMDTNDWSHVLDISKKEVIFEIGNSYFSN